MFNPFSHPICFANLLRTAPSTWIGHTPFAMFLTDILRPDVIVELGTYYGTSYCAFCQAVDQLKLNTKCYAVDTWEGDPQSGFFGGEVLDDLRNYHDRLYGKFSRLIQSTFDEAIVHFEDKNIDLLHIDGFHTYDEVKKDFQKWLPKTSDRAVVLFHDINVKERDFGVWQFWKEIKSQYPNFEFTHSHGLGILAVGEQCPTSVLDFLSFAGKNYAQVQDFFYQLGQRFEVLLQAQDLRRAINQIQQEVNLRNSQLTAKEQELQNREQSIGALSEIQQQLQTKDEEIRLKDKLFAEEKKNLELKITETKSNLQLRIAKAENELFDLQNERVLIEEGRKRLLSENQHFFAKKLELQRILLKLDTKESRTSNLEEILNQHFDSNHLNSKEERLNFVIGIVTYNNTQEQIEHLLNSIETAIENVTEMAITFKLFVIDNGSETFWNNSKLNIAKLNTLGNIGFGKGMNHLMESAFADPQTRWFLCLNPDGVLHYKALDELVKLSKVNPYSLVEARQFPEEHLKDYDVQTLETLWASGACLLIPKDIYEKTKGFDTNFFMYLEDVDLSWRARAAGFSVKVAPNAFFGHSVLDREFDLKSEKYFFLSGRYLAYKWKNQDFLEWTENELVQRGYYPTASDLPRLPTLAEEKPIDNNVADFKYHFHFSPARW